MLNTQVDGTLRRLSFGQGLRRHRGGGGNAALCAAEEMVGGLFYYNYPGGSGLIAGMVYGRLALKG